MITNARVLQADWVPRKIVHRNPEKNRLRDALVPVPDDSWPEHVRITVSGAGETRPTRHSLQEIAERHLGVATEHVDRRAASRPFRVLVELLDAVAPTRCIHRTTARGALDRSADTDTPRLVAREEVGRGRVGDVHPGSTQDLPAVVGAVPG